MNTYPAGAPPLPPAGFYRRFIHNPATIAECGGPCAAGGPEACDCGALWQDLPWDGASAAEIAAILQKFDVVSVNRAWGRMLASLDAQIAELQRQRNAHLAQRDEWIRQAIGESKPLQPPA
jgi:hypothetical protein